MSFVFPGVISATEKFNAEPIQIALIEGLSGVYAHTGGAVYRNLVWAVDRINARGGVRIGQNKHPLLIKRYDNKNQVEESLLLLKAVQESDIRIVMQGNSSAVAAALVQAINKHNKRYPNKRMVFLNYSAVDPALTNENCSFWHFRFDAHVGMRMSALMQVLRDDLKIKKVYLIAQDYSFGHAVIAAAKQQLASLRPDIQIVAEDRHPIAKVKDFSAYISKAIQSGADAIITGNWGNDLSLLVKAAKDLGFDGSFYTFYGNALGTPTAIGYAGVDRVIAVSEWLPNGANEESLSLYKTFQQDFPKVTENHLYIRMQVMIEALAKAIEEAGTVEAEAIAQALSGSITTLAGHSIQLRRSDHQAQQTLIVSRMEKKEEGGILFDAEGSGFGFLPVKKLTAKQTELPSTCTM
jgi:branched-chain amino acid transport system substrate-binding protein